MPAQGQLTVIYRSTGGDNRKNRPPFYSKMLCLRSFLRTAAAAGSRVTITFVNDGPMPDDRLAMMHAAGRVVSLPGIGNSPSYREALKLALELSDDALVYLAEDDYLYTVEALPKLLAAFSELSQIDYITLYDHLDRYIRSDDARGGQSRLFLAAGHHWRTVESTCMTFGARVGALRRDAWIHSLCTRSDIPKDRTLWRATQGEKMFGWKIPKRKLIGPVPSLATHMDPEFMAPNVDWERVAREVEEGASTIGE